MQTRSAIGVQAQQQGLAASPLLSLQKLDKRFGATHALKGVDLSFDQGEIHAIVGENGAGKSTLIKLLTGVHPRTSGEILWQGAPVALANPHEAIGMGIKRRPPGSRALPASVGRREPFPGRRDRQVRLPPASRHDSRGPKAAGRTRVRPAGGGAAFFRSP